MDNKKIIAISILVFVFLTIVMFFFAYQRNSKRAETYFRQGLEFANKNDYQNAYYNFSKISKLSSLGELGILRQAICALDTEDKKTAYQKLRYLTVFSKDDYIAPYALYNSALINIEHKKYKAAYKKLSKLYKNYPQSDYKKAASYHLGYLLFKKNPSASKDYFLEYLEYAPSGRYSKKSAQGLKKLGLFLNNEEKYIVANSLYENKDYNAAYSLIKDINTPDALLLSAKILEKAKNNDQARLKYLKALSLCDEKTDPKDILYAIERYDYLSNFEKKDDYKILLSETKHSSAYPAVLFVYSKYLPKIAVIKNAQTIYQKYSSSYWASEALWRVFWYDYKNGYNQQAKKLAKLHIQRYKNTNSSARIKYWYGKILLEERKSKEARSAFKDLIKSEPDTYYAYLSENLLSGVKTPLNTKKRGALKGMEGFNKADLNKLFVNKNLAELAYLSDIETLEKMRPHDDFQKSYIAHKKGRAPYSVHLAREALNKLEIKPEFSDIRYELAYPILYGEQINKYSKEFSQNPYLMIALIREESTFNPKALSSVGACGLMQLMSDTASSLGFGAVDCNALMNPDLNIRLGVKYFSSLSNLFNKNEMLATLAYNGGPSNVSAWKNKTSHNDFDAFVEDIPYSETQNYIKRVFRSYWNYTRIYAK